MNFQINFYLLYLFSVGIINAYIPLNNQNNMQKLINQLKYEDCGIVGKTLRKCLPREIVVLREDNHSYFVLGKSFDGNFHIIWSQQQLDGAVDQSVKNENINNINNNNDKKKKKKNKIQVSDHYQSDSDISASTEKCDFAMQCFLLITSFEPFLPCQLHEISLLSITKSILDNYFLGINDIISM